MRYVRTWRIARDKESKRPRQHGEIFIFTMRGPPCRRTRAPRVTQATRVTRNSRGTRYGFMRVSMATWRLFDFGQRNACHASACAHRGRPSRAISSGRKRSPAPLSTPTRSLALAGASRLEKTHPMRSQALAGASKRALPGAPPSLCKRVQARAKAPQSAGACVLMHTTSARDDQNNGGGLASRTHINMAAARAGYTHSVLHCELEKNALISPRVR